MNTSLSSLPINTSHINKLYDNLTFFDTYGGSVILIIFITILLLLFIAYTSMLQNLIPIKENWATERCKLPNILFAGYINKPDDSTIAEFTQENFNYCTQNILQDISDIELSPLSFITNSLNTLFSDFGSSIGSIQDMFNSIRTNLSTIVNDIFVKLVNITIPLRLLTISISDTLGKTTGVLVAIYYVIIGSFDLLGSVFGAYKNLLESILIIIAVTVLINPLAPAAMIMIGILLAMTTFLIQMIDVNSDDSVRCFDKNTPIIMENNIIKRIIDVQVGDKLLHSGIVTDKLIFCAKNVDMYKLPDNTIVSGNHYIKYNTTWIQVKFYPKREKLYNYNESFIYCINTSSKRIIINNNDFLDWDDIIEDINIKTIKPRGFKLDTPISLFNKSEISIQNIRIGDILSHGEKVFGLVETLDESNKLYHLLTNTQSFYINNQPIYHYD